MFYERIIRSPFLRRLYVKRCCVCAEIAAVCGHVLEEDGLCSTGAGGSDRNMASRLCHGLCLGTWSLIWRICERIGEKDGDPVVSCCKVGGLSHFHCLCSLLRAPRVSGTECWLQEGWGASILSVTPGPQVLLYLQLGEPQCWLGILQGPPLAIRSTHPSSSCLKSFCPLLYTIFVSLVFRWQHTA